MKDKLKVKYLKIIQAYDSVIGCFGNNAPFISKSRIIDLTISKLKEENICASKRVVYRALNETTRLKKEEFLLL